MAGEIRGGDARRAARRVLPDSRRVLLLAAASILLRLVTFLGRGDFVAFDEAWYLLLGRSLWDGEGYRLTGLRHTTLSPLFPVLAGALGRLLGDLVWAGRIVAAVTSGLLVLPCWFIFRRLAGRRTAWLGCLIVAVLPSLAAFTVPYWVGWDLWMGPEPVFHLFLFTGLALALRGHDRASLRDWALAGAAFALAYLARPEAVVIAGLLAAAVCCAAVLRRSRPWTLLQPLVFAITFGICAAPYWIYLHDALGRWTLTGRHLPVAVLPGAERSEANREGTGATERIERMLWQGQDEEYARSLYGLHPSGTRLVSTYWGVWPDTPEPETTASPMPPDSFAAVEEEGLGPRDPAPARPWLYVRALGIVVPAFVWPFIGIGGTARRRRELVPEAVVAGPLLVAGVLIASLVSIDARTQLVLGPLLALYAARGIRIVGVRFDGGRFVGGVRRGVVATAIASGVVGLLFFANVQRLYSSVTQGSPHHVLGAENRVLGEALREVVPPGQPIMSWDPSVAIYAQRDWRVLPYASLPEILRYATAIGCEYVLFSRFYPSPPIVWQVPENHLLLRLPPSMVSADRWRVELTGRGERFVVGQVVFD